MQKWILMRVGCFRFLLIAAKWVLALIFWSPLIPGTYLSWTILEMFNCLVQKQFKNWDFCKIYPCWWFCCNRYSGNAHLNPDFYMNFPNGCLALHTNGWCVMSIFSLKNQCFKHMSTSNCAACYKIQLLLSNLLQPSWQQILFPGNDDISKTHSVEPESLHRVRLWNHSVDWWLHVRGWWRARGAAQIKWLFKCLSL